MSRRAAEDRAGVPLGGVGTGCIELGRDGRFRNVTINNNRTAAERIPLANQAFLALRAGADDGVAARILQPALGIPFQEAGIHAPYVGEDNLQWRGLYPCSTYRLADPAFPLKASWRALSPVLPYDPEAATLPLMMVAFQLHNTTSKPYSVSALFNWENLRGCTAVTWPEARGPNHVIALNEKEELMAGPAPFSDHATGAVLGVCFGLGEPVNTNSDGNYSLVAATTPTQQLSRMVWDSKSPEDLKRMWWSFHDEGRLPDTHSDAPAAHCAALCVTEELAPRSMVRITFLLTWYCPQYVINGVDRGNGYALTSQDSIEIAGYGLRHHKYFLNAVENWHQRFLNSSFPKWFSRMLLNSAHVYSTNTLLTRNGEFCMMESPAKPESVPIERSFYTSLGTLLFFPPYAHNELGRFLATEDLVLEALSESRDKGPAASGLHCHISDMLERQAIAILCAARNFRMTGTLARLMDVYPELKRFAGHALVHDEDNDGLPEVTIPSWTYFDGNRGVDGRVAGLWAAAWHALAYIAKHMKDKNARRYEILAYRASKSFESKFWQEQAGCYRYSGDSARKPSTTDAILCKADQLASQAYLRFLHLDDAGGDPVRLERACATMRRVLDRPYGAAMSAALQPNGESATLEETPADLDLLTAGYAAALTQFGHAGAAFEVLKTIDQNLTCDDAYTFNVPREWDVERNTPAGDARDRHMGALAAWHVLYAVQGFLLAVPDKTLYVAPNLPEGLHYLSTPVFTPVCLGWLTYRIDRSGRYRQSTEVSLESPVHIRRIELRVPAAVPDVDTYITCDGDPCDAHRRVTPGTRENTIRLDLPRDILVQDSVSITVVARSGVGAANPAPES